MGEGQSHHGGLSFHQLALHHHHQPQQRAQHHTRVGRVRSAGGEIVEVQGGHIVRSTGRKDRHSKVCTAKGPRDRRVRLAAHTAIQFYDVQDRLGYDRPSKAVDWLIKNAKPAIDQLEKLPAWTPTATVSAAAAPPSAGHSTAAEQTSEQSSEKQIQVDEPTVTATFSFDGSEGGGGGGSGSGGIGILPPSLDNNSIADTIKSLFPMAASATPTSSSPSPIGFQSYPTGLLSRTSNHSEDLRLSLQSLQDPIFHQSQSSHHQQNPTPSTYNSLLAGPGRSSLFDAASAGWAEQNRQMPSWYTPEPGGGGSGGFGEFSFTVPPPQVESPHSALGLSHFFSQRGPLQSSNSPSVRSWAEPAELQMHPVLHPSLSPIGFASETGLSGFCIPGRIQGEEEHGSILNKLPSASRR